LLCAGASPMSVLTVSDPLNRVIHIETTSLYVNISDRYRTDTCGISQRRLQHMDEWQAILGLLIIVVAMISFILEKMPIAITAVGASLLMVAIGALSFEDSYVKFGSTATVFTAC